MKTDSLRCSIEIPQTSNPTNCDAVPCNSSEIYMICEDCGPICRGCHDEFKCFSKDGRHRPVAPETTATPTPDCLIHVSELPGKQIKGVLANVTAPQYRYLYQDGVGLVRRLIKAQWTKKPDGNWLYLFWERDTTNISDCGYSGWREHSEFLANRTIEILSAEVR